MRLASCLKKPREPSTRQSEVQLRQEKVVEADKLLKDLCASKLSTDDVLIPTKACLENAVFKAKFEELQVLKETIAKKEDET